MDTHTPTHTSTQKHRHTHTPTHTHLHTYTYTHTHLHAHTPDTGHCLAWWPGASFDGQVPRWYPRFLLGDLFVTTLRVKWPGASFGGQAPRWYPRFCWAVPKKKEKKNKGG